MGMVLWRDRRNEALVVIDINSKEGTLYCVCGHSEGDHQFDKGSCRACACQEFRVLCRLIAIHRKDVA